MKSLLFTLVFLSAVFCGTLSTHAQNSHSLEFSGSDWLNCGAIPDPTNNTISFCAWFKHTTNTGVHWILTSGLDTGDPHYKLGLNSNHLRGSVDKIVATGGGLTSTASFDTLTSYQWHFGVFVYDDDSARLYVDGVLDSARATTWAIPLPNTNDLLIGRHEHVAASYYWEGLLDEISIWDRALTAQEINDLMQCSPTGTETDLLGYWNFDEGTGTLTADQTSNANDASFFGSPTWSTDVPSQLCAPDTCTVIDTMLVTVLDTVTFVDTMLVNDTTFITLADTIFTTITDTLQVIDTSYVSIVDTSFITMMDTVTVLDTVIVEELVTVTDTLLIDVVLSTGNPGTNTIRIFPNPANELIIIDHGDFASMANYRVRITNTLGAEVFNQPITAPQVQLPTSQFGSTGTYFVQIIDPSGSVVDTRSLILY